MNRREVLEWTRRWYGPAVEPILPQLSQQVELLTRATDEGVFFIEFFEAAMNNETPGSSAAGPPSSGAAAARAAAGKIDFATSNLRGAPFTLYVSGARVLTIVTMGPVAGTACNATALSYENGFDIGLFIDPTAIEAPGDFRDAVAAAFTDILAL